MQDKLSVKECENSFKGERLSDTNTSLGAATSQEHSGLNTVKASALRRWPSIKVL